MRRLLRIDNEMRELLVLDFDGANGVAHGGFINRSDGYDLVSSPMDLAAGLLHNLDSLYARHLFGFARIDIGDARVGVGRANEGAVKQALGVVIVCVFCVASGLCSAIDAAHTAADVSALVCRWVGVLVFGRHHASPFEEAVARDAIMVVPALPCGSRPVIWATTPWIPR